MILDSHLTLIDILLKIALPLFITFLIAGFIGLERQNVGKSAGISSHILVAAAACGIAILQRFMYEQSIALQATGITTDPENQRLIAQVITGVGFIGAGVIIKDQARDVVRGITTAATVWTVAMNGLILGSGYIVLGTLMGLFFVLFIAIRDINRGINPFKKQSQAVEDHD